MKKRRPDIQFISGSLLIITICLFSTVTAGDINLSSHIDNTDIAFEEAVNFEVKLTWEGSLADYSFEILSLPETDKLKVVGTSSSISTEEREGVDITIRSFKYSLEPTLSGTGIIKPLILRYVAMPDSIPGQLTTPEFKILIADPVPKEKTGGLSTTLIIVIGAIIIFVVIVTIIKSRRKTGTIEPQKSAEEIFIDTLEAILKESHSDRKQFFTRLYKLLVSYVESKYGISAGGKTTVAILNEIEALDIPLERKEKIIGYLTMAEKSFSAMVK
jgi:hypothetical protein